MCRRGVVGNGGTLPVTGSVEVVDDAGVPEVTERQGKTAWRE